jgi:predicted ATPase
VCHYDFNFGVPDRLLAEQGRRVEVRSHPDDALFLVEPTDPALTTEALMAQYGFEDARRYYERHHAAYTDVVAGLEPVPQRAAHGERAMFSKRD